MEENDNVPLKRFFRYENCGKFLRGYLARKKRYIIINTQRLDVDVIKMLTPSMNNSGRFFKSIG